MNVDQFSQPVPREQQIINLIRGQAWHHKKAAKLSSRLAIALETGNELRQRALSQRLGEIQRQLAINHEHLRRLVLPEGDDAPQG
jgi:hypothetical protein